MQQSQQQSALVAARYDPNTPNRTTTTDEIVALAETAGYDVVDELTQTRPADSTYQFGRGKAEELARRVAETGVDAVVVDNPLSPQQAHSLRALAPEGTAFVDRHRLVLDIFARRAGTREAKLQVQLAELRYELPRVRREIRLETEAANERRTVEGMNEKEHRRVLDIRERIQRIEEKLDSLDAVDDARRTRHREAGRDLVALAGYANAGKSTLLRRLADDLDVDTATNANTATDVDTTIDADGAADVDGSIGIGGDATHPDEPTTAAAADRLFETLDTTTRRASVDGRRLLVTDTVGFVRDLPPWLVDAFESTLVAAYRADVVLLVVDASDSVSEVRAKAETCHEILDERAGGRIVPVLSKADLCSGNDFNERREVLREFSRFDSDPVVVSAIDGTGVDRLLDRAATTVPTERATVDLPNVGETQAVLSWAYDRGSVEGTEYDGARVRFTFVGRPEVVDRLRAKAAEVQSEG